MADCRGSAWTKRLARWTGAAVIMGLLSQDAMAMERMPGVSVDASAELRPAEQRASGFLHSVSFDEPPDEKLMPLKPGLFRSGLGGILGVYPRGVRLGAQMQVGLGGQYLQQHTRDRETGWYPIEDAPWPGDDGDFSLWLTVVDHVFDQVRRGGFNVHWDIWNEPDHETFWKRDREQFFQAWSKAAAHLRDRDPEAVIVGPSLMRFDREYLFEFLRYMKEQQTLPDILSWHEMGRHGEAIPEHAAKMREFLAEEDIDVDRFSINEYIGPGRHIHAGSAVSYLANLERAKVDSAARACWAEPEHEDISTCWNNSLNGLLTPHGKEPRPVWWVYRRYAQISGTLHAVEADTHFGLDAVAGYDRDDQTLRILLGHYGEDDGPFGEQPRPVDVHLKGLDALAPFDEAEALSVQIERIPAQHLEALESPRAYGQETIRLAGPFTVITLETFAPGEVYWLVIEAD